MRLISSGSIKNIEEIDNKYKLSFSLYNTETGIPSNMQYIYSKSIYEKMIFQYHIMDFETNINGVFNNTELIMEWGLRYDKSKFYLLIGKNNTEFVKCIEDSKYEFEVFMNEENPIICGLSIVDSIMLRTEKLRKIKEKINN